MTRFSVGILLVCLLQSTATSASAQSPFPVDTSEVRYLNRIVRDRWIHSGQLPGFTVFDSIRHWTEIRSLSSSFAERTYRNLDVRLGRVKGILRLDEGNAGTLSQVTFPPLGYRASDSEEARADARRRRLIGAGAKLNLPEALFWDLVHPTVSAELPPGSTWTDTLTFMADPGDGLFEELKGLRHNRIQGDTLIDGQAFPVIQTRAEVRYQSRELARDRGWTGPLQVERDVEGFVEGWMAVDRTTGLRVAGRDSTVWIGTAVLTVQDGRSFSTPARYERYRTWHLQDSLSWAVVQDSLQALRRQRGFSMIRFPGDSLQIRLSQGDSILADSLWGQLNATEDPREFSRNAGLLRMSAGLSATERQSLESMEEALQLQVGDTAGVFGSLVGPPWTDQKLDVVLPFLDNLGELWRLGRLPGYSYTVMAGNLRRATPLLEPDSLAWTCTPSACRRIIGLLETAKEARLRDVALSLAATREPARWHDRLTERVDSGSMAGERTLNLLNGVVGRQSIPQAGADWREWFEWMGKSTRLRDSHRDALIMYQASSDRDLAEELLGQWPPRGDSAQVILGRILKGMGAVPLPTSQELADRARNGSPVQQLDALMEAGTRIEEEGMVASRELQEELLPPFLRWRILGGPQPWSDLRGTSPRGGDLPKPIDILPDPTADPILYLLKDSLPEWAIEPWESRVRVVDSGMWRKKPARQEGRLLTVGPVITWGPFVQISSSSWVHELRGEEQSPRGYAAGNTYLLLRTDEGWGLVIIGQWIT